MSNEASQPPSTGPEGSADVEVPVGPAPAPLPAAREPLKARAQRWASSVAHYFSDQDPTLGNALPPAIITAALLFVRSPLSNYIFDEQEALLANPYVNAKGLGFWQAFQRDFWGLPPDRSIGSYRPLPNLIWRLLFHVSERPFLHHLVNVLGHALNAALLASLAFAVTRRRGQSWLVGGSFLCFAVLTEAVTGVVGIADVMGGLGVIAALQALRLRWLWPLGVLAGLSFGLFSKESAIVGVPLLAWSALVLSPALHPEKPRRFLRLAGTLLVSVAALVGYTVLRKRWFPVVLPADLSAPLPASEIWLRRALQAFLRWFQQPMLPHDPINNPLVDADLPHRLAGAFRVYARGLGQVLFPTTLSGDYSFPQEPIPEKVIFPESVIGALALLLPPLFAVGLWVLALVREQRERKAALGPELGTAPPPLAFSPKVTNLVLLAIGLVWVPIAYFPHSNIPVLLPTVRAERFWYLPCVGAAFVLAVLGEKLLHLRNRRLGFGIVIGWFVVQAGMARWHAIDYTDDLIFWRATKRSVPNSAKAHLNYSVMVGARGQLDERLKANERALELAPQWPMAHVYLGDTLCRMHRAEQAWTHYARGFELAPNDPNLIALGLQCLWDEKVVEAHKQELLDMSERNPGSWLAFLASDIVYNGQEHGGVQRKYRPRAYDEGPKE